MENRASELTANELSEVLGIHWWIVNLPSDLGPKDGVAVIVVSADGKQVEGGSVFSPGPANIKLGPTAKVFCWEDKASKQMNIRLEVAGSAGSFRTKDYFEIAATGGPANGAVLKPDDILLKFDSSKSQSFTGGNEMLPGQVGLKVVVKRG